MQGDVQKGVVGLVKKALSVVVVICISLMVFVPCYAAPAQEPQPPQGFKEKVEKSKAENDKQRKQVEAEINATAAKVNNRTTGNKIVSDMFKLWIKVIALMAGLNLVLKLIKIKIKRRSRNRDSNKQDILDAGVEGERQTAFHLSFLPKGYTVLHNVIVRSDGLSAENDHVVISSAGIILVETKNYGGTIYIRPNGWVREKFGKKEGCDSPIAQSERHKLVLENFLTKRGLGQVPIYIVVAISNSQAIIEGEDPRCPVMKSENLPHWIRKLPTAISEEQTNDLRNLFVLAKKKCSAKPGEAQLESL